MQDEPSTKGSAVGDDVTTTPNSNAREAIERARRVLEHSRAVPPVLEHDQEMEEELAKHEKSRREIAADVQNLNNAANSLNGILQEMRPAILKYRDEKLKALARIAAQALSAAEDSPAVEDLGRARELAKTMSEAAAPLLRSPLAEDTRQNQTRLLIASVLALLVGSGLLSIEKVMVAGAEGKFEPGKLAWVVVAIVFACLYCLTAFIGAYRRDILTSHVSWADAASQLRVVGKQLSAELARLLQLQWKELEELKSCSGETEVRRAVEEQIRVRSLQLELLGQLVGMYHGIMHRTRSLMRLRLWMEFLLPFTVVLIALGLCGRFLLVVATW